MIFQNDKDSLPIISKSGCFARSSCKIAEDAAGRDLTAIQINNIWVKAKEKGWINADDNIVQSAPIANLALKELGRSGKFFEVGTAKGGKISWYPSVIPTMRRADALIQKIAQSGPQKMHFRQVNVDYSLKWDPHNPPIKSNGEYYTILYCFQEA